jgi:hypothetical protein
MNDKKCRLLPTLFLIIYRRDFFRAVREKSVRCSRRPLAAFCGQATNFFWSQWGEFLLWQKEGSPLSSARSVFRSVPQGQNEENVTL